MIITNLNLESSLEKIRAAEALSLDTETTGLLPYTKSDLFSIIVSTDTEDFYFNFQNYPNENIEALPGTVKTKLAEVLKDPDKTFYFQNAKFDMAFLAKHGIFITGKIYDLKFLDRIHNNQHLKYSLADISKRWGSEKLDIAKNYVEENKLSETIKYPELNKEETKLHYELVPFKIMSEYGCQDARATYDVSVKVLEAIAQEDNLILDPQIPKQMAVVENESRLVHTLFNMEYTGVKINRKYCEEAKEFYLKICEEQSNKFKNLTGIDFVKGTTVFEEVFSDEREKWRQTDKGSWQWNKKVLSKFINPAASIAGEYAEAKKQLEYFQNFLWFADSKDIIHSTLDQSGAKTGRFSSYAPNVQNLSSPDKYEQESDSSEYSVREAVIPRDGFLFVMIDYAQSEFRLFLEYAKAVKLIDEVKNGKDLHQANADIAGVTRKQAKTIGFGLLYGQGIGTLTQALYDTKGDKKQVGAIYKHIINFGITDEDRQSYKTCTSEMIEHDTKLIQQAVSIKKAVIKATPVFKSTMDVIKQTAESRGYIRNFYGRRLHCPDKRFSYQATNHLIQSSCADMLKFAMNRVDDLLKSRKSRMVLQIHDELVLEMHPSEMNLVLEIKDIMEKAYPYKLMPQAAEVSFGYNLAEKEPWSAKDFKYKLQCN